MGARASYSLTLHAEVEPSAPYDEAVSADVDVRRGLANGTGSDQIRRVAKVDLDVAASSDSADQSLAAVSGPFGGSVAFDEVRLIRWECPTTNVGNMRVKPGAVNPWLAVFGATSLLEIPPGCAITVEGFPDDAYDVTATSKTFLVTNVAATQTNRCTYTVIGP